MYHPEHKSTPPLPFAVRMAGATHMGRVRRNNEDAFGIFPDVGLACVADGVGGHAAGEIAARLAVECVASVAELHRAASGDAGRQFHSLATLATQRCLDYVNAGRPGAIGMATTLVALRVGMDGMVKILHIGDSRAYLIREGRVGFLTEDHSEVMDMVKRGIYTREEARIHPRSNIITRCVMADQQRLVEAAEITELYAQPGDRFLLCTDGLTDMLPETAIEEIVTSGGALDVLCDHLIEQALDAGGRDNVTVALVELGAH